MKLQEGDLVKIAIVKWGSPRLIVLGTLEQSTGDGRWLVDCDDGRRYMIHGRAIMKPSPLEALARAAE